MSAQAMSPRTAGESELRLTPRGRRVMWSLAAVLVAGGVLTGGRAVAEAPAPSVSVDSYTVGTGETLWSIASAFTAPGDDVRDTVDRLADLNGMEGRGLVAGEQILVPAGE